MNFTHLLGCDTIDMVNSVNNNGSLLGIVLSQVFIISVSDYVKRIICENDQQPLFQFTHMCTSSRGNRNLFELVKI